MAVQDFFDRLDVLLYLRGEADFLVEHLEVLLGTSRLIAGPQHFLAIRIEHDDSRVALDAKLLHKLRVVLRGLGSEKRLVARRIDHQENIFLRGALAELVGREHLFVEAFAPSTPVAPREIDDDMLVLGGGLLERGVVVVEPPFGS